MRIDQMVCTACGECIDYCPVVAIREVNGTVDIDFDECVECGNCLRYASCPTDAIIESPEALVWPRLVRRELSNSLVPNTTGSRGQGRGTEEAKSNDVTGRVKRGRIGMGLEFGRPGVGARLREVEKMSVALARLGVNFEPANPVYNFFSDPKTGAMREDVRNERVLSAILEFELGESQVPEVVATIERVATTLNTVFSWCVITRVNDDGSIPIMPALQELALEVRPNAKVNVGLGRPLVKD